MMEDSRQLSSRSPIDWVIYAGWGTLIVILALCAWLISMKPAPSARAVPVPKTDLPAYHLLKATDLTTKTFGADSIPEDVLGSISDLIGLYTLAPLAANKPITVGQLHTVPDLALISGTVSIGIPATPATAMAGNLQAGSIVDILLVPVNTAMHPKPTPSLFENILVLDVKSVAEGQKIVDEGIASYPYVVIIALPADRRLEFAGASSGATLFITRKK